MAMRLARLPSEHREMVVYSIDEIAAIVSGWRKDKAGQITEIAKACGRVLQLRRLDTN
jgi:hypothetical protein